MKKCSFCHLFVVSNTESGSGIAPYVHLHQGDVENFKNGAFITLTTPGMYTDFDLTPEQIRVIFTALAKMEK